MHPLWGGFSAGSIIYGPTKPALHPYFGRWMQLENYDAALTMFTQRGRQFSAEVAASECDPIKRQVIKILGSKNVGGPLSNLCHADDRILAVHDFADQLLWKRFNGGPFDEISRCIQV